MNFAPLKPGYDRDGYVVVREFQWRYPVWKIDPSDESTKGVKAAPQTQEYRVNIPAGGKKSVTYTVLYSGWQH